MKISRLSLALCVLAFPLSTPANQGYPYASVCPNPEGPQLNPDQWAFIKCQCTSYVAFRLNSIKPEGATTFTNYYGGPRWSNANFWGGVASAQGITVDDIPKIGSVAWWDSYKSGTFEAGHVAFVDGINSDGTIEISEYNYSQHSYTTRTISNRNPSGFIHIYPDAEGGFIGPVQPPTPEPPDEGDDDEDNNNQNPDFDFKDLDLEDAHGNNSDEFLPDQEARLELEVQNDGDYEFDGNAYVCAVISTGGNVDDDPDIKRGSCEDIDEDDIAPDEDEDVTLKFDVPSEPEDYNVIACIFESEPKDDDDFDKALGCSDKEKFEVVEPTPPITPPPPQPVDPYLSSPCGTAGYTKEECMAILMIILGD